MTFVTFLKLSFFQELTHVVLTIALTDSSHQTNFIFPLIFQECIFNKRNNGSVLHVIFEGSMRVGFCTTCCKRWFFAFDGIECQDAKIEARLQGSKLFAGMEYRHVRLEGYCARTAGQVPVELWVEDCLGHRRAPKVPFVRVVLNPRISVEEISLTEI